MVYYLYIEKPDGSKTVLYDIESWCWECEYAKDDVNRWRTKYVVTPIDINIINYVYNGTKAQTFDYHKFMDGVEAINAIKKQLNPEYSYNKLTNIKDAAKRDKEYQHEIYEILKVAAKDMNLKLCRD